MPGQYYGEQDADIDLPGLFQALWRKRLAVLASTVVFAGLAFAGASSVAPKYQAETRILIEAREPGFVQSGTAIPSETRFDEAAVSSQVQLLQSVDLIKAVARQLKLHENPEFDPSANPSVLADLLVLAGLSKNPLDMPPEERVLREFTKKLSVYQVEKSRVIAIEFSSEDPKLAAAIPNAMAEIYMSLQSGAKLDNTQDATKWLEPEIANLREKVREAEAKVAAYRAKADLLPTGDQNTFAVQQLNDISAELARVRGERANAEARAQSIRSVIQSGRNVDTLGEVVGSQMIQRLKESQSAIEGQIADLSTTLLEGHPRLKALRAQLAGIGQQLTRETKKILASLENEAGTARLRETQLVGQLNALKADTARAGEEEVGLKALEREAASQRQLLESYLIRYREAMSRQDNNSTPADARVVSSAVVPDLPYFPKILPITVVAGFAGFILSAVAILLAELLSGRAMRPTANSRHVVARREPEEAIPEASVPPVRDVSAMAVAAPLAAPQETSISAAQPAEVMADPAETRAFEQAAEDFIDDEFSVASVARYLADRKIRIAVCVSPTGDEGSTATVMLARSVAETGAKTILVDMTGSGAPTRLMAEQPGLSGITDLLTGEAAFADTIHADRLSDAHLIPQGRADVGHAMKSAGRLAMILDALAGAYDLVVVECGPADAANVRALMHDRNADIVVSAGSAGRSEIDEVVGRFLDAGYEDIVLMIGRDASAPEPGRRVRAVS